MVPLMPCYYKMGHGSPNVVNTETQMKKIKDLRCVYKTRC